MICLDERNRTYLPSDNFAIAWLEQYVHLKGHPLPNKIEGYSSGRSIQRSHILRFIYGPSRSSLNDPLGFFKTSFVIRSLIHKLGMLFFNNNGDFIFLSGDNESASESTASSPSPTHIASNESSLLT